MEKIQRSFLTGAFILSIATMICRFLGAVYRIPYQNITGNEGMYVYSQVYPLYSVLLLLATAGFPLAISKLVSERIAKEDWVGVKQIHRVSMAVLFVLGSIAFLILYFGAPWIATWMGSRQLLTLPIQSVSFALLIIPFTASLRGVYQGQQEMIPSAVSQVSEQLVRVITILACAWYAMSSGLGVVYAGAGAIFGATTGAFIAVLVLVLFRRKSRGFETMNTSGSSYSVSHTDVIRALFAISLPICINSLLYPLFGLVDSFTIANFLADAHWSVTLAINEKGIYDRGGPLLQFAAFFATGIALSIVPAMTIAKQRGQTEEVEKRANIAVRLTWMLGLPSSIGLAIVAMPTNVMLFKDAAGSDALLILSFSTIFVTLSVTSAGILQGLGRVILPAVTIVIAVIVKWVCNFLLIPIWDINGAALATVLAYAISAGLNLWVLKRSIPSIRTPWMKLLLANGLLACAALVMKTGLLWVTSGLDSERLAMSLTCLGSVLAGVIVYLWAILRFKLLAEEELAMVPKLGKWLGKK
ncbi:polysaccharide biosynthesis protein [Shimazuella sp. AN120528]|uniref:putative polysaccharide biosynthesis protein n=1 Tax=Shimazuella soli TaxID=1892854 RepID=UPI001F1122C7|nr:polysaccharide biosynthesis protein [Shimazuella soli]MCH5585861.1 polysaccharide biosynthesis protein [Shimazuella soli]